VARVRALWQRAFPPALQPLRVASAAPMDRRSGPARGAPLLQVNQINKRFGGLVAVNDVSFNVKAGEIVGLIGPNGAGKSTTFNLVTGLLHASSGRVSFNGATSPACRPVPSPAWGLPAASSMCVCCRACRCWKTWRWARTCAASRVSCAIRSMPCCTWNALKKALLDEAARALHRVGLQHLMHEQAGNLALGQQRILEIARALCCDPLLLLLDEPAAGLRHLEKQALSRYCRSCAATE
jgi:branched-chain amino acid transport system permease protein